MRIVFLNTWNGEAGRLLRDFLKSHIKDTDIFCLQEVDDKLYKEFLDIFSGFKSERAKKEYKKPTYFRQATFWRNELITSGKSESFIKKGDPGIGFATNFDIGGKNLLVCNVHGHVHPGTKVDSDERLKQSKIIIDYARMHGGPVIIGGDFNLDIATKSVAMFEEAGFRNLIKIFKIEKTRNDFSWKKFNNIQFWADFTFVTKDIEVKNFEVPDIKASDHLPMILDFELNS